MRSHVNKFAIYSVSWVIIINGRSRCLCAHTHDTVIGMEFEGKKFSEIYRLLLKDGFSNYHNQDGYRLGLDFGTSFTKASYSIKGDSGRITFNLGKDTKPSVVYFDENNLTLSMFKTSDSLKQIHYFKATMAKNKKYVILKENKVLAGIKDDILLEEFFYSF